MAVVYHWKHGWIPLDHEAALSKAKGNHEAATQMLSDANLGGIKSRQDVAKAVRDLPNVSASNHDSAMMQLRQAADHHNSTDLLPGRHRKTEAPSVEYQQGLPDGRQNFVTAHINGERVGEMSWDPKTGTITWTAVYEDKNRRKGIASAMLKKALEHNPNIKHNRSEGGLTDLGRLFADATPIKRASRK